MTTVATPSPPTLSVGSVFSDSLRAFAGNWFNFLTIALIALAPVYLARHWYTLGEVYVVDEGIFDLAASIVESLLGVVAEAGVVYGTLRHLQNHRASFGDSAAAGLRKILPVGLIALIVTTLVILGFFLFVIPAFIAMTIYMVAVPVVVAENAGAIDGLKRSASLTMGWRWRVFGIVALVLIVEVAVLLLIEFRFYDQFANDLMLIADWLMSSAATAFYAVVSTVTYRELRRLKEGADVAEVAAVFD